MNNTEAKPSSDAQVVLDLYTAMAASDLLGAQAVLADDVVLHVPGSHPLAGSHVGPDAVVDFALASRASTDAGEDLTVLDVLAGEKYVGVYCHISARRAGRATLDNRTIHLVRIDQGRIAEIWLHNFDGVAVNDFWS